MKSVIAICLVLSLHSAHSAIAATDSAYDALTSVVSIGAHPGINDRGAPCLVEVKLLNSIKKDLLVTVTDDQATAVKEVLDNSFFGFKPWRKEFILDDKDYPASMDDSTFTEDIIRTVVANDNKLYVVVSNLDVLLGTQNSYKVAECVINQ